MVTAAAPGEVSALLALGSVEDKRLVLTADRGRAERPVGLRPKEPWPPSREEDRVVTEAARRTGAGVRGDVTVPEATAMTDCTAGPCPMA